LVTDLVAVGIDSAAAVAPDSVTDLAAVGIDSAAGVAHSVTDLVPAGIAYSAAAAVLSSSASHVVPPSFLKCLHLCALGSASNSACQVKD
jgi:hypothetical protein